MHVGQSTFPVEYAVNDVMIDSYELEERFVVPCDTGWQEAIPLLACVFTQAFVADGVEALGVLEAGAQHVDGHALSHGL